MRGVAYTAVAVALTVTATGCGEDRSVKVVAPTTVKRQDLARYPAGTPARATLELLRAVQLNDPVAGGRYVAPALGLSRAVLVRLMTDLRHRALGLPVPRRLTVEARDAGTTSVVARVGRERITLRWARAGGGWRLAGIGARSESMAKAITDYIFFAHHPRLHEIRAGQTALFREWYAIWNRIRRIGR